MTLYSPSHCLNLIRKSRINVYAEEVNFSDIILFNDETKIKKPFLIFEAKQIEVRKNSLKVFVKFDHKQDFIEFDILKNTNKNILEKSINTNILSLIPKQEKPLGISSVKYKSLKKLSECMPTEYRFYYKSLKSIINDLMSEDYNKKRRIM